MKHVFAYTLAALFLVAAAPWSDAQTGSGGAQPRIASIRGKVVTVRVPEGFDSVTLQALRRPSVPTRTIPAPRPIWRTIDTQFPRGESATLTFRLGKLTPARNLRVFGTTGEALPESYLAGPSQFGRDPLGPASGKISTLWRSGRVSTDGVSGAFEAGTGGTIA
jgi:hypothetical protein